MPYGIPLGVVQQQIKTSVNELALATNPYAYYDFQDANYATGLLDVSGNGRHLSVQGSGPQNYPAVRSTTSKAAWWSSSAEAGSGAIARLTSSHFFYDPGNANLGGLFFYPGDTNQTRATVTFSWSEYNNGTGTNFVKVIGWRESNSASRWCIYTQYPSGTGHSCEYRTAIDHTGSLAYNYAGSWVRTSAWSIITIRFDGSIGQGRTFRNGASIGTLTDGTKNSLYASGSTSPFEFPGNFTGGGGGYARSDFMLFNQEALSDATIIALHNAYMSELL